MVRRANFRTNDRRSRRQCYWGRRTNRTGSAMRQRTPTRASPCGSARWPPGSTEVERSWSRVATSTPYDKLLIATGSAPRRLDVHGAELDGLLTLRTLEESLALRARFTEGAKIVIVGAGWIGCEAAAAARHHGAEVTMIEPRSQPLLLVVGEQIGATFAALHRDHGVDLRLGVGVKGFAGDGVVSSVQVKGGHPVPADTVLIGVGAAPNIALADAAGLKLTDGGIAVDATLRSSDPDIYAAGDVAAHDHPKYRRRVRVEHWANAKDQGLHVAGNLLGAEAPYELRPFFFSDQYDLGCEYRRLADPAKDRLVVRGDLSPVISPRSGSEMAPWQPR